MYRPARVQSESKDTSVFSYDLLPKCARSCNILQISERNCLPPAAPTSNPFTYRTCVCQSDYLRSLHENGMICHDVCNDEDDEIIHSYYNIMCTFLEPTKTTTSISMFSVTSAAVASTAASTLVGQPPLPVPAPTEIGHTNAHGEPAWFDQNGKYLVIVAGITFAIVAVLFGIAHYSRRNDCNSTLESRQDHGPSIALQSLTSQSAQPHRNAEENRHLKISANADSAFFGVQSPSTSSPFAPPNPSYRFGHTIRAYAETKHGEGTLGKGGTEGPAMPSRSLSGTERLIRERIKMTGRPDIPISATPKVTR